MRDGIINLLYKMVIQIDIAFHGLTDPLIFLRHLKKNYAVIVVYDLHMVAALFQVRCQFTWPSLAK